MKRSFIWTSAFLIIFGLVATVVRAQAEGHNGRGRHAALGCNQSGLGLTSAQKAQVSSIWNKEKPAVARLVNEFARENREMQSLAAQENVDPKRLQSLADQQGATFSELVMEKEKLMMQFQTQVLKPNQRVKVQSFESCLDSRVDEFAQNVTQ